MLLTPVERGLVCDDSFSATVAVVAIGGLITSTVLSLLVVPAVFEMAEEVKQIFVR